MTRRIQRFSAAVAALTALALGGAVFAQAQSTPSAAHHERTSGPDLDNIQSGDETAPDKSTEKAARAGETASETGPSDGPGGHADPAGATADHQFSGVE